MYKNLQKKSTIGFFPFFCSLGDTFPLIKIAKEYMKLGGEVIFFSHGGIYENLANELGCKIFKVAPYYQDLSMNNGKLIKELQYGKNLPRAVDEEIKVFKETNVKLIVTSFNLPCSISARVVKIPLVCVSSGTTAPHYFESGYATFPDEYEFFLTRLLPNSLKDQFSNWFFLNSKIGVRRYKRVAKKYEIMPFRRWYDIKLGDHYFACDNIEFLHLNSTANYSIENYIGPILSDEIFEKKSKQLDHEIKRHMRRPGKSILLSLGSSGTKDLFLKILTTLNYTNFNVIAVYTSILNEDDLPKLNDNILLKKFIPSIKKIHKMVDIAIIHGGRGTVYTAAYSGKPIIGIPMQPEQQWNLDNLVRHGTAIRLSKKYFKEKKLLKAITDIFDNYDTYLKNAQDLAKTLPKPNGDKNAASRLIQIIAEGT